MTTGGSRGPAHTAPLDSGHTGSPGGTPGHTHQAHTGLGVQIALWDYLKYLLHGHWIWHMSPESWDLVRANTTWRQIQNKATMFICLNMKSNAADNNGQKVLNELKIDKSNFFKPSKINQSILFTLFSFMQKKSSATLWLFSIQPFS